MKIWTDETLAVIDETASYTDAAGVQHLGQRDKATIPGLIPVTLTARPDEAPSAYTVTGEARGGVKVTGWHIEMIEGYPTQVWETAARTEITPNEAELIAARDLSGSAQAALDQSDVAILRCAEKGVTVPPPVGGLS